MTTITQEKQTKKAKNIKELQIKAAIFDEILEFVEDRCFGYLMGLSEKEKNIPLSKAKKFLR